MKSIKCNGGKMKKQYLRRTRFDILIIMFCIVIVSFFMTGCGSNKNKPDDGYASESVQMDEKTVFIFKYDPTVWTVEVIKEEER